MEKLCFMTNVSAESWMQLTGSIIGAAIGALTAIALVMWQHHADRLRTLHAERKEKIGQFDALIDVAAQIQQRIEWALSQFRGLRRLRTKPDHEFKGSFEILGDALAEFKLMSLPAYLVIGDVGRLRTIVHEAPTVASTLAARVEFKHFAGEAEVLASPEYARLQYLRDVAEQTTAGLAASRFAEASLPIK